MSTNTLMQNAKKGKQIKYCLAEQINKAITSNLFFQTKNTEIGL